MEKIIVGIVFTLIGLIGILKNKLPKHSDGPGPGFAAYFSFYFYFYVIAIIGVALLVVEIW